MIVDANSRNPDQKQSKAVNLPRFSPFWAKGFEWFLDSMRRRHLEGLAVSGLRSMQSFCNLPWIFVANHPGNWDGFLLRALQKKLRPKSAIFSMMLEEELIRRPLFRRIGGIGLRPNHPVHNAKVIRMLRQMRRSESDFVLSIFPQGQLRPSWNRLLHFQEGVTAMATAISPAWVFPIALHYENLRGLKPTAFIAIQKPILSAGNSVEASVLEASIGNGLHEVMDKIAKHGEDLPAHWTAPALQTTDVDTYSEWWPA
jgi:1-acyl-sn-glycerol-3-phosphate acyltransferase